MHHLLVAPESGMLATGMPAMLASPLMPVRSPPPRSTSQLFSHKLTLGTLHTRGGESSSLSISHLPASRTFQRSTLLKFRYNRKVEVFASFFGSLPTLALNAANMKSLSTQLALHSFSALPSDRLFHSAKGLHFTLARFTNLRHDIPINAMKTTGGSKNPMNRNGKCQPCLFNTEKEWQLARSRSVDERNYPKVSAIPVDDLATQLNSEETVPEETEDMRALLTSECNGENTSVSPVTDGLVGKETVVATGVSVDFQLPENRRSTTFEQWARKKVKEDGASALPVIEELRQTFTPGSPVLDSYMVGARKVRRSAIQDGKGESVSARVVRRSSKTREGGSSQTGSLRSVQGARSLSTSLTSAESSNEDESDAPAPQPLLVKRTMKFPVKWNGRWGSVLLVDKPQGLTSFAVCAKLRSMLKIQKVGHAGTLDPMATGLLIVCLGNATKLADSFQAMTKVYSGTIRLGELTPSLDADTEVSGVLPWEHITDAELEKAKEAFIGDILQTPPMFSAVKINGERLYKKARRGEDIEVPARQVSVADFQLERSSENRQEIHFKVTCSKGTYVRSLCADLARSVGSYGHLKALRREKIGKYSVKEAWPVPDFEKHYYETTVQRFRS